MRDTIIARSERWPKETDIEFKARGCGDRAMKDFGDSGGSGGEGIEDPVMAAIER
jgi:hypothetical protein